MLGKTHIITNTAVCLGVTMAAGFIGFGSASAVTLGAVEGSILPDIDQKYSYNKFGQTILLNIYKLFMIYSQLIAL